MGRVRSYRLVVRTSPFHGENVGANPAKSVLSNRYDLIIRLHSMCRSVLSNRYDLIIRLHSMCWNVYYKRARI